MTAPYTVFSEDADHIGAECPKCRRVLNMRKAELTQNDRQWMALKPIICPCGYQHQSIADSRGITVAAAVKSPGWFQLAVSFIFFGGMLLLLGFCVYREIVPAPPSPKTAEEIALESAEAVYGKKPPASAIDGKVYLIDDYLKTNLKDPGSLDYIRWWEPAAFTWGDRDPTGAGKEKGWAVSVQYRARNSFGGMVIERQTFLIRNGRVISVHAMDPAELH